jgi:VRR-NUC domain-containing protein
MYRESAFFFAEVKSSGDKLSDDQKNWIRGNTEILKLPLKLVKIHRASIRNLSDASA